MRPLLPLVLSLLVIAPAAWADTETDKQTQLEKILRAGMLACANTFAEARPSAKGVIEEVADQLDRDGVCIFRKPETMTKEDAKPLLAAAIEILDSARASLGCETDTSAGCMVVTRATFLARSMTRADDATQAPDRNNFLYNETSLRIGNDPDALLLARLILDRGAPAEAGKFAFATDVGDVFNDLSETPCPICQHDAREALPYVVVLSALEIAYQLFNEGDTWQALADIADKNAARWESYHFGGGQARTPLPWELVLNGFVYSSFSQPKEGPLVDSLPQAPDWSITFLHPSVGITPFDDAGADSTIVGVVELLGYSWWDYAEDNTRTNEWGLSAVSVYQPRDNGKDWNYGLLLRTPVNGLNVVWSRVELDNGDDEDIFAFSVDPGTLFENFSGGGIECLFGLKTC
jgi:hypothetical protein